MKGGISMKFSVILPIYNVEKYLQHCIDSVLQQTFDDYEILLVDDGSTDNSPYICDQYEKEYPRICAIHKENGGMSSARNAGLKHANGEYIVFIDSDDFLIDEEFLKKIDEVTHEKIDLVFYKYQKYYNETGELNKCSFSYESAMKQDTYANKIHALVEEDAFYGMAWIKAIRRNLLLDNNIEFEEGLLGEDMEWNYHLLTRAKDVTFLNEAYIAYRQRSGSITSTMKLKNLTDFIYVLEKWSSIIKKDITDKVLQEALLGSMSKYYSNLYVVYSRVNDKKKRAYVKRIKDLDWLFDYSMSYRPKMICKIYKILGFYMTTVLIRLLDGIKK